MYCYVKRVQSDSNTDDPVIRVMFFTTLYIFTVLALMALPEVCWENYPFLFLMDNLKRNKGIGSGTARGFSWKGSVLTGSSVSELLARLMFTGS